LLEILNSTLHRMLLLGLIVNDDTGDLDDAYDAEEEVDGSQTGNSQPQLAKTVEEHSEVLLRNVH
jgi:hypothetical protein